MLSAPVAASARRADRKGLSQIVPDFLGQRYDSNFLRIWTCIGCTIFYILLSGAAGLAVYGVQQLRKEAGAK